MTGKSLAGKVAVVTGAADGMGRAIAALFAREGANVLATDVAAAKLEQAHMGNASVRTLVIDVTEPDAADRIVSAATEAFGALHILVNAAGIFKFTEFKDLTEADWQRMMDVNLNAPFRLCMRAIPELKKITGGRIVNIASTNAERARRGMGAYTVSKHGLAGLTISLAVELGEFGITANYINPGTILTGITRDFMDNPVWKNDFESLGVVGRVGTVDEIAQAALYLVGPNSGYTTGHGLVVDGGFLIRYPEPPL